MKNYDGHCEGNCYECVCQKCEGNCAMNCIVNSRPEEIALIDDNETHVVGCFEFNQFIDL